MAFGGWQESSRRGIARPMPEAYDVTIQQIIRETPEVKTFRLGPIPENFTFEPGQFVTVACDIPGDRKIRRAYSIANPPTRTGFVDITIRKMDDGRLSKYLCDQAYEGMPIQMLGPYGKFTFKEGQADRLVLIGAGSGVVPLMCMVRYARDKNLDIDLTLLYSSKTWDHVIYRDELEGLNEELEALKVMHTLTRVNEHEWHGFRGRISKDMIAQCLDAKKIPASRFYICGPPTMVDSAASFLAELGAAKDQILVEKYD
mgnify:CR=1 FL=1